MDKRKLKDITIDKETPGLEFRGNGYYTYKGDINARNLYVKAPIVVEGNVYVHDMLVMGSYIMCDNVEAKTIMTNVDTEDKDYRTLAVKGKLTVGNHISLHIWVELSSGRKHS